MKVERIAVCIDEMQSPPDGFLNPGGPFEFCDTIVSFEVHALKLSPSGDRDAG